jgi:acetyl esterase
MPLDPATAQLLQMIEELGIPPFDQMAPEQCREVTSSLADPSITGPEMADVRDTTIEDVPVRVYVPHGATGGDAAVLVWFHGGGWVIGSVANSDVTARELADGAGVVVVSVDYRLAPEHKFPAAVDDCGAVTRWILDHGAELGVDPGRVAVGGDSAGGNLAAIVAHELRGRLGYQLLIYPAVDATMSSASIEENADGYLLTKDWMQWFYGHYLDGTDSRRTDARLSPLYAEDWSGLPAAFVLTAEFDPLRDEGEAYAQKLRAAGVDVWTTRYDGQIHGFFGMGAFLPAAELAMDEATTSLRAALKT